MTNQLASEERKTAEKLVIHLKVIDNLLFTQQTKELHFVWIAQCYVKRATIWIALELSREHFNCGLDSDFVPRDSSTRFLSFCFQVAFTLFRAFPVSE